MQKERALQILRFIAAAGVVYLHAVCGVAFFATGRFGTLGSHHAGALGGAGVDLFFVISGAIIYKSAFEKPTGPGLFFTRRLQRVVPLYWLMSAIYVAVLVIQHGPWPSPTQLLTLLTFWPAWDQITMPPFSLGWSLSFEMLFYACAALVLHSRRWLPGILCTFAALCLLRHAAPHWPPAQFLGNPICLEFLFGVGLMKWRRHMTLRPVAAGLVVLAGVAFLLLAGLPDGLSQVLYIVTGELSAFRVIGYGLPAAMLVWGALNLEPWLQGRAVNPLVYLGDASYSIYLTHGWIFGVLIGLTRGGGISPELAVVLSMAVGVGGGCLAYEAIEKPFMARFRYFHAARRGLSDRAPAPDVEPPPRTSGY
jgi:exopolysaccharide production protein ExoZ